MLLVNHPDSPKLQNKFENFLLPLLCHLPCLAIPTGRIQTRGLLRRVNISISADIEKLSLTMLTCLFVYMFQVLGFYCAIKIPESDPWPTDYWYNEIFSPPVHMHCWLICIAFHLSLIYGTHKFYHGQLLYNYQNSNCFISLLLVYWKFTHEIKKLRQKISAM